MKVSEVMQNNIVSIPITATIQEAARVMSGAEIGSILVTEKGKYVGIVTERDLLKKVVAMGLDPTKETVKNVMSSPLITIDENEYIETANDLMNKNDFRRLPITRNGEIKGIITSRTILKNIRYSMAKKLSEDHEDKRSYVLREL
jgi:CBS domain-containing protein